MEHLSGRQRGGVWLAIGIGLMGAAIVAMVVKACHVEPVVSDVRMSDAPGPSIQRAPPAPPALPEPSPSNAPAPAAGGPLLVVHNPCSQVLLLAVNFGDARGQRVNAGFFEIRPGARLTPAAASGRIVVTDPTLYYYTETPQTEPVETGNRQETVGERVVGMKRIRLEAPERPAIDLECPGATSGRP